MTQDEIIALAGADKFCRTECEEYTHECYMFSIEELEAFYHAAQRQAYERAAEVCMSVNRGWCDARDGATAIRTLLIEGDSNE